MDSLFMCDKDRQWSRKRKVECQNVYVSTVIRKWKK